MVSAKPTPMLSRLSTWAVKDGQGGLYIVIVDKDAKAGVAVDIDLGRTPARATRLDLRGPSLEETTGVTLGGAKVSKSGEFAPVRFLVKTAGTHAHVGVEPASAVLVYVP
jgi:hypothetical protein